VCDGARYYETRLRRRFGDEYRVSIRPIEPRDMPAEYEKAHIIAVPTIFSDGTSLSCIEGMLHGCVPVVTDVGGLANLVIPEYNALIVRPCYKELLNATRYLLDRKYRCCQRDGFWDL